MSWQIHLLQRKLEGDQDFFGGRANFALHLDLTANLSDRGSQVWHLTATVCTTFSTLSVTDTNHLFHFSTVSTNVFYSDWLWLLLLMLSVVVLGFMWTKVIGGKVSYPFVNLGISHSYQLRRQQEDLEYIASTSCLIDSSKWLWWTESTWG